MAWTDEDEAMYGHNIGRRWQSPKNGLWFVYDAFCRWWPDLGVCVG